MHSFLFFRVIGSQFGLEMKIYFGEDLENTNPSRDNRRAVPMRPMTGIPGGWRHIEKSQCAFEDLE